MLLRLSSLSSLAALAALALLACSGSDDSSMPASAPPPATTHKDAGAHPANDAGAPTEDDASGGGGGNQLDSAPAQDDGARPGWKLVWRDEFDLSDGSPIDDSKWSHETGNSGWGNNRERQFYTDGTENAEIRNGALVITAKKDGASNYQCQYGTCKYTSARFNTSGKFEQKYGRFEARIQVPRGQGMWPAWWMLGTNIGGNNGVGWPSCGEIDVMENVGYDPSGDHGSLHGPGYSGGNPLTAAYEMPNGQALADAFHVYTVEWEENVVRFYFDETLYETRTPADVPEGKTWVYDHPFFLILNLAVGGQWPGDPDNSTQFPQTMKVDYVRVYSR